MPPVSSTSMPMPTMPARLIYGAKRRHPRDLNGKSIVHRQIEKAAPSSQDIGRARRLIQAPELDYRHFGASTIFSVANIVSTLQSAQNRLVHQFCTRQSGMVGTLGQPPVFKRLVQIDLVLGIEAENIVGFSRSPDQKAELVFGIDSLRTDNEIDRCELSAFALKNNRLRAFRLWFIGLRLLLPMRGNGKEKRKEQTSNCRGAHLHTRKRNCHLLSFHRNPWGSILQHHTSIQSRHPARAQQPLRIWHAGNLRTSTG